MCRYSSSVPTPDSLSFWEPFAHPAAANLLFCAVYIPRRVFFFLLPITKQAAVETLEEWIDEGMRLFLQSVDEVEATLERHELQQQQRAMEKTAASQKRRDTGDRSDDDRVNITVNGGGRGGSGGRGATDMGTVNLRAATTATPLLYDDSYSGDTGDDIARAPLLSTPDPAAAEGEEAAVDVDEKNDTADLGGRVALIWGSRGGGGGGETRSLSFLGLSENYVRGDGGDRGIGPCWGTCRRAAAALLLLRGGGRGGGGGRSGSPSRSVGAAATSSLGLPGSSPGSTVAATSLGGGVGRRRGVTTSGGSLGAACRLPAIILLRSKPKASLPGAGRGGQAQHESSGAPGNKKQARGTAAERAANRKVGQKKPRGTAAKRPSNDKAGRPGGRSWRTRTTKKERDERAGGKSRGVVSDDGKNAATTLLGDVWKWLAASEAADSRPRRASTKKPATTAKKGAETPTKKAGGGAAPAAGSNKRVGAKSSDGTAKGDITLAAGGGGRRKKGGSAGELSNSKQGTGDAAASKRPFLKKMVGKNSEVAASSRNTEAASAASDKAGGVRAKASADGDDSAKSTGGGNKEGWLGGLRKGRGKGTPPSLAAAAALREFKRQPRFPALSSSSYNSSSYSSSSSNATTSSSRGRREKGTRKRLAADNYADAMAAAAATAGGTEKADSASTATTAIDSGVASLSLSSSSSPGMPTSGISARAVQREQEARSERTEVARRKRTGSFSNAEQTIDSASSSRSSSGVMVAGTRLARRYAGVCRLAAGGFSIGCASLATSARNKGSAAVQGAATSLKRCGASCAAVARSSRVRLMRATAPGVAAAPRGGVFEVDDNDGEPTDADETRRESGDAAEAASAALTRHCLDLYRSVAGGVSAGYEKLAATVYTVGHASAGATTRGDAARAGDERVMSRQLGVKPDGERKTAIGGRLKIGGLGRCCARLCGSLAGGIAACSISATAAVCNLGAAAGTGVLEVVRSCAGCVGLLLSLPGRLASAGSRATSGNAEASGDTGAGAASRLKGGCAHLCRSVGAGVSAGCTAARTTVCSAGGAAIAGGLKSVRFCAGCAGVALSAPGRLGRTAVAQIDKAAPEIVGRLIARPWVCLCQSTAAVVSAGCLAMTATAIMVGETAAQCTVKSARCLCYVLSSPAKLACAAFVFPIEKRFAPRVCNGGAKVEPAEPALTADAAAAVGPPMAVLASDGHLDEEKETRLGIKDDASSEAVAPGEAVRTEAAVDSLPSSHSASTASDAGSSLSVGVRRPLFLRRRATIKTTAAGGASSSSLSSSSPSSPSSSSVPSFPTLARTAFLAPCFHRRSPDAKKQRASASSSSTSFFVRNDSHKDDDHAAAPAVAAAAMSEPAPASGDRSSSSTSSSDTSPARSKSLFKSRTPEATRAVLTARWLSTMPSPAVPRRSGSRSRELVGGAGRATRIAAGLVDGANGSGSGSGSAGAGLSPKAAVGIVTRALRVKAAGEAAEAGAAHPAPHKKVRAVAGVVVAGPAVVRSGR